MLLLLAAELFLAQFEQQCTTYKRIEVSGSLIDGYNQLHDIFDFDTNYKYVKWKGCENWKEGMKHTLETVQTPCFYSVAKEPKYLHTKIPTLEAEIPARGNKQYTGHGVLSNIFF